MKEKTEVEIGKKEEKKMTAKDVIERLEKLGVEFSDEKNPFGKIRNASMMGPYRPIYFRRKRSFLGKVKHLIIKFFKS
ncbi:MAG: hypothetical protein KKD36_08455 [Bacteroidetes bacterium]|nr:hypothetical protein [Bacteroidota bacterium]